ncbi:MAG: efflux RND transporter permease subunit [Mangrovicoccus sp.]
MFSLPLSFPRLTLALTGAFLLACCLTLLGLKADRATDTFLPRGDISFAHKQEIERIYNISDPLVVDVSAKSGDLFTPRGLALLEEVSYAVEELPGLRLSTLKSLVTQDDIIATEDGFDVAGFLDEMPQTEAEAAKLRERVQGFDVYDGLIISRDGRRAAIVSDLEDGTDVLRLFAEAEALAERISAQTDGAFELRVTGPPIVTGTLNLYMAQDAFRLDPVAGGLSAALLFLCLRSVAGVMLPMLVMLPSVAAAFALMSVAGFTFTPFSNAVPVVIIATSIADSVHLIAGYYDRRLRQPGESRDQAILQVLKAIWIPILFTSLSTGAGFWLLSFGSPMIPVQQFGVTVAFGVMAAFVFSVLVLPAGLLIWRAEPPKAYARMFHRDGQDGGSLWARFTYGALMPLIRRPILSWGIIAAMLLAVGSGLPLLKPDYEPASFFPTDSRVSQDYYDLTEAYIGANFIEVDLDLGQENAVYEPDFLQRLAQFQTEIEAYEAVGATISLGDFLRKMHQAYNEDDPAYNTIPDRADLNAQYFLLYNVSGNPRRFDELTDEARSRLNLRIVLHTGQYAETHELIEWLRAELPKRFPEAKIMIGGETFVVHEWMDTIFEQVLLSVGASVLVMFGLGLVFLRSLIGAFLLLLPPISGVALTYAWIAFAGTPIGLGTSVFAAIAIGAGIDFAIHFLWAYRRERQQGGDHETSVAHVFEHLGKVIVINALIVAGGFSVLLLATTLPPRQVGTYVAISILASLVTTFIILGTATRAWTLRK